jgi:hypothetical protein
VVVVVGGEVVVVGGGAVVVVGGRVVVVDPVVVVGGRVVVVDPVVVGGRVVEVAANSLHRRSHGRRRQWRFHQSSVRDEICSALDPRPDSVTLSTPRGTSKDKTATPGASTRRSQRCAGGFIFVGTFVVCGR